MRNILSAQQNEPEAPPLMDIPSAMATRSLFWKVQFLQDSAILPHLPLLFWLVEAVRPSVIVTLGLGDGVGHFALCQAADKLDLSAVCLGYAANGTVPKPLQDHNDAQFADLSQLSALDLGSAVDRIGQGRVDLFLIEVPEREEDVEHLIRNIPAKMAPSGIVVLHGTGRGLSAARLRDAFATLNPLSAILDFDAGDGLSVALMEGKATSRATRLFEQLRADMTGRGIATTILRRLGASLVLEAQSETLLAAQAKVQADAKAARRAAETTRSQLDEMIRAYDLRGRKSAELQARLFDLQQAHDTAQAADLQSRTRIAALEEQIRQLEAEIARQKADFDARTVEQAQQIADLGHKLDIAKKDRAKVDRLTKALTDAEADTAEQTAARANDIKKFRAVLAQQNKDLSRIWQDAAKLEERVLSLYASTSWAITRPFRVLTRLIRREKPAAPFRTRYLNRPQADTESRLARILPVVMREVTRPGSLTQENLVRFLRYQLWGGAATSALPRLETILTAPKSTPLAKLRAASALSTWYDYSGDPARALSVLEGLSHLPADISRDRGRIVRMAVLHTAAGRPDEAQATLETVKDDQKQATDVRLIHANLGQNDGARLSRINKVFETHGFATLRRSDPNAPLSLGNIETVPVEATIEDQGLVSVIMPTFNAAATIETALRSLLNQSYRNLEIIVVDDCSTDATAQVVEQLAQSEPRLRLIRQPRNAGAYPARNRGLQEAGGVFITTHDSDDWSHPQKIEQQLMILSQKPKAMGAITHWARVRPSLHFTTNWRLSDEVVHWSHSSLLFRRAVFENLGGWDNVRVSADTEFIWRIEAAYGRYSVPRIHKQVPLAFALDDESSLTRTKLTHVSTTYYGLRHYYREISRYWLSKHPKGLTDAARAAKWAMLPIEIRERSDGPVAVDLWFTGDMTKRSVVSQMETLAITHRDKSIGVTHVIDPTYERDVPSYAALFCNEFFEFLQSSGARIVLPGVEVQAKQKIDLNISSRG